MDLKIKDVADLFNVSESTIRRWISDGKIPTYRINQLHPDYRFSISEMESWVLSHKLAKTNGVSPFAAEPTATIELSPERDKKVTGGVKQFSLFRAIHKGDVLSHIAGRTKEEIIRATMKKVARNLHFDAEMVTELLLDRERMMPTALNNGIGVPHTRDTRIGAHDVVVVVSLNEPLDYGALDGKPVHTLFFLFACNDKHHLHLLAKIAHLSSHPQALEFFQTKPSKDQLLEFVKDWESGIAQVGG